MIRISVANSNESVGCNDCSFVSEEFDTVCDSMVENYDSHNKPNCKHKVYQPIFEEKEKVTEVILQSESAFYKTEQPTLQF